MGKDREVHSTKELRHTVGRIAEIRIDQDSCLAHEMCGDICPEVFELDPELGVARVRSTADRFFDSHERAIREAVFGCPVACIHIEEMDSQTTN